MVCLCSQKENFDVSPKVPVAGKNGKLNETIEVSALWSNGEVCRLELRLRTDSDILNMSVLVLIIKPS